MIQLVIDRTSSVTEPIKNNILSIQLWLELIQHV